MTLVEFDGSKIVKTEFNNREELDKYVIKKYNIDLEDTYEEVPDTYEAVHYEELEEARKFDELAGYYDEYSYGYWIE